MVHKLDPREIYCLLHIPYRPTRQYACGDHLLKSRICTVLLKGSAVLWIYANHRRVMYCTVYGTNDD
jgi:hypothetical protein